MLLTVSNFSDSRAIQFTLTSPLTGPNHRSNKASSSRTEDVQVTGATVRIYVNPKITTGKAVGTGKPHRTRAVRNERLHSFVPKKPPQRIKIQLYTLTDDIFHARQQQQQQQTVNDTENINCTSSVDSESGGIENQSERSRSGNRFLSTATMITDMWVIVREAGWKRILLPTTLVQRAMDSDEHVLRLLVVCDRCEGIGNERPTAPVSTSKPQLVEEVKGAKDELTSYSPLGHLRATPPRLPTEGGESTGGLNQESQADSLRRHGGKIKYPAQTANVIKPRLKSNDMTQLAAGDELPKLIVHVKPKSVGRHGHYARGQNTETEGH